MLAGAKGQPGLKYFPVCFSSPGAFGEKNEAHTHTPKAVVFRVSPCNTQLQHLAGTCGCWGSLGQPLLGDSFLSEEVVDLFPKYTGNGNPRAHS